MKRRVMLTISVFIGILAFWFILHEITFTKILNSISKNNWQYAIFYLMVSILIIAVFAYRWKIVLKAQNIKIRYWNLLSYRFIGYGISYLTPSAKLGGEPVRAGLLTRHGIEFSKALSSVVIDKTIEIASSALFFFVGVMIVLFRFALPQQTEIMMLFFALAFLVLMIFVYHRMVTGRGFIADFCRSMKLHKIKSLKLSEKKLEKFENRIIKFFQEDKKAFLIALLLSFLSWILMFFEYKFAALIVGYNLSFLAIFLIVSFVGMAFLVPIPMAMGSLEASQIAVFKMMNISSAAGVALALIVRIRDLIWSVIGMTLLSYYGFKISQTLKKGYEKNN